MTLIEGLRAWITGQQPEAPCCAGCAHGHGCDGTSSPAAPAYEPHAAFHRHPNAGPATSSWSWKGRMVLDAQHWIGRPMPRSPLGVREWAELQTSAAAQHINLFGRHYLTMPLTYKPGKSLTEVYGENLTAMRPFGRPQPTPSATWTTGPIGLVES